MKGDRFRVPSDPAYDAAIGLAVVCFARLEWSAVWCCQRLTGDYLAAAEHKTAGQIAGDLAEAVKRCSDPAIVDQLRQPAAEFARCVKLRNALIHSEPITSFDGEQRLSRGGSEWKYEAIGSAADEFAAAAEPFVAFVNSTN